MKKYFSLMAIFAAMAMTFIGCSKDDNDTDSTENRLNFTNKLTQNSISCTWEGYNMAKRKELGNWNDDGQKYAVMRFDRATKEDIQGTGLLLYFENNYKDTFLEGSEFTWYFADDMLRISYRHSGWSPQYAEYRTQELVINGDRFDGTWFEKTDFKYKFNYTKSAFSDWSKYIN